MEMIETKKISFKRKQQDLKMARVNKILANKSNEKGSSKLTSKLDYWLNKIEDKSSKENQINQMLINDYKKD